MSLQAKAKKIVALAAAGITAAVGVLNGIDFQPVIDAATWGDGLLSNLSAGWVGIKGAIATAVSGAFLYLGLSD